MRELALRQWHRKVGIVVAPLLAVQAFTGLWMALDGLIVETLGLGAAEITGTLRGPMAATHHAEGAVLSLYRVLLASGTLWMAGSGTVIFRRIRARQTR